MTSAFFKDIKLKCTFFEMVNSSKNFPWVTMQTMQGKEQNEKIKGTNEREKKNINC